MKRDRQLTIALTRGLKHGWGTDFDRFEFPEDIPGPQKAVDAVAINSLSGYRLAIEHTLVQPFVGEKEDTEVLRSIFQRLETDPTFIVPGFSIDLCVPVGAIPRSRRFRWNRVREIISPWFLENGRLFPVGTSYQNVPGLPFDLTLFVSKRGPADGHVFIFRTDMPETFADEIGRTVREKVPKLAATDADKRVLLLEKDNLPRGYTEAARHLDKSMIGFAGIDEVWLVNTAGWDMGGDLWFLQIWPGGVSKRFRMRAPAGYAHLAELIEAA